MRRIYYDAPPHHTVLDPVTGSRFRGQIVVDVDDDTANRLLTNTRVIEVPVPDTESDDTLQITNHDPLDTFDPEGEAQEPEEAEDTYRASDEEDGDVDTNDIEDHHLRWPFTDRR